MKRDLYKLSGKTYDLVIVGGGITGACIARDAALRGLKVALLERNDFASATTGASSKLIHGGLRYLENLELGLVREALRERRIWSNNAPHLVDPLTFLMPTSGNRIRGRLKMALGLTAYDWLAYDRNRRLDDPEKAIPSHDFLSRDEAIALEPCLESFEMKGAMVFYDYQMYSPERLTVECLMSAEAAGARVANYAEVTEFVREEEAITGVRVRDKMSGGAELTVRGRIVINAAGPWADLLMSSITGEQRPRNIIRSEGIHLITRPLTDKHGVAVRGEQSHFFVLPWRGHSLIGTTDTSFSGHPDDYQVTEEHIQEFLGAVNEGFPSAELDRSEVRFFYGGLRPIVDTATTDVEDEDEAADAPDTYNASRASEVYDHEAEDGLEGMITAIGGKWTTSRHLAEQIVDLAIVKLRAKAEPCTTEGTPVYGGNVGPFSDYLGGAAVGYSALPKEVVENLARNYGGQIESLLNLIDEEESFGQPVCEAFPDIQAQIVYAVREEMALSVEDVLLRRTGLGTLGWPGDVAAECVARVMAQELDWDEDEQRQQIEGARRRYASRSGSRADASASGPQEP